MPRGGLAILSLRSQELLQSSSVVEAALDYTWQEVFERVKTWGFLKMGNPQVTMGIHGSHY
jgi:hypothetical protein